MIALCCIAFVVVAAFLLFDLDEKLFSNTPTEHPVTINYVEAPNHTVVAESALPKSKMQEKPAAQKPMTTAQKPMVSASQKVQKEPKSRLPDLESRQFKLDLNGDARIGQSNMAKKASLTFILVPIKGTNLQEFKIAESRFVLDGSSVLLSNIGVKINDRDLVMDLNAEGGTYKIHGKLDKAILDSKNNKQNVSLHDQTIYLTKKDAPYLLNLSGTLTS